MVLKQLWSPLLRCHGRDVQSQLISTLRILQEATAKKTNSALKKARRIGPLASNRTRFRGPFFEKVQGEHKRPEMQVIAYVGSFLVLNNKWEPRRCGQSRKPSANQMN